MSAAPVISAVIPTLGRRPEALGRALACLSAQTASAGGLEVLVVSDAADADPQATAALAARHGPPSSRHLRAGRTGASAARNAGWRAAMGALVLFLDDDILADPPLIAEHIAAHRRNPQPEAGVLGHVRWADELRRTPLMHWLDGGVQFDYRDVRDGDEAGWWRLYTANVSLKRAALSTVGGFDEEGFPFGYEDLDLGLRLHRQLGLQLRFCRAASAQHLHEPSLQEWRRRVERIAASERRFVARHPGMPAYFHERFAAVERGPAPRGRGARLASVVPPSTPWLGPRVHASAGAMFTRDLAPRFLAAWERAAPAGTGEPTGAT